MRRPLLCLSVSVLGLVACGDGPTVDEDPGGIEPVTTIWMQDNRFDPQGQTVAVGTPLTWLNKDRVEHDVDFTSGGSFKSDPVGNGETIKFTPGERGEITYGCSVHPGMDGVLVVE
jgi:plastocyanin